jgi:acyl carrier protein
MENDLVSLIVETLEELQEQEDTTILVALDAETSLFGRKGMLDSLGLVTLIVALEQKIEDKFGTPVALADEKALSQLKSPFRTVGSLAEYAVGLLQEANGDG